MRLDFSKPIYVLAPLAGLTDLPFRSVVKKFGADLTVSEMISSHALVFGRKKTEKMLQKSPLESPYAVQIAGSKIDIVKQAVEIINEHDGIDIIDLNCGCPAPKVVRGMQGSALLTDLKLMAKVLETIKKYSNKKYLSVKMRLGFNEKVHKEAAKVCEACGVDFITVHGRTRKDRYKAPVDYDAIKEVKESVSIPVIANGDITTPQKAKWVLEYTKCDGVMIGRGALGRPWIFQEMKDEGKISKELIREVILEHLEQMLNFYGEYGVVLFRKHLHTYSKNGFKDAAAFRDKVNKITQVSELKELIYHFFS